MNRHEFDTEPDEFVRVRSGLQRYVSVGKGLAIFVGDAVYLRERVYAARGHGYTGRVTSGRVAWVDLESDGDGVVLSLARVWSHADGGDLLEGRLTRIEEFVAQIRELSHPPGDEKKMGELIDLLAMFLPHDASRRSSVELVDD
jgi:hypothetical protein